LKDQDPLRSDELLHYVRGSLRQQGYYRKRPWTYDLPKKPQRKARALFAQIAHDEGTDKTGLVEVIDKRGIAKEIPASAVPLMDKMKRVAPPKPVKVPTFVSRADRIRKISEILARIPPST